jgi:hypothetical protein
MDRENYNEEKKMEKRNLKKKVGKRQKAKRG